MPTYRYKCDKCSYVFEKVQRMADKPIRKCPKCSSSVKRVIGAGAGIIFKGNGFYQTDYKSKGPEKSKKQDNKPACGGSEACKGCPADTSGD